MPTPEETKAMHNILLKLQEASNKDYRSEKSQSNSVSNEVPGNVSADAVEMFNILNKLNQATEAATKRVLEETVDNPELSTATYQNNTISVNGEYNIQMEKKPVIPGVKKTFYNITDHNNQPLYEDIALFESAMLIVKGLMTNKIDTNKIVSLDERYASYLAEAALYKQKAKTITESHRRDLADTKHGVALDKMKQIKSQIKRFV